MSIEQQQGDEERRRREDETLAAKRANYLDYYDKRDRGWESWYKGQDMAPDGRPLMIGTTPFDEYCKPHKDSL